MNMYCYSKLALGMFGSSYFVGFTISSFLLQILSNKIGRKWTLFIGTFQVLLFMGVVILVREQYSRYIAIGLIGLAGYRAWSAYLLGMELVPDKHGKYLTAVMSMVEVVISQIFSNLLFWLVRVEWYWFYVVWIVAVGIPVMFLGIWIGESPKLLYEREKFTEARAAVERIAKFNGKTLPANYQFEAEVKS